MTRAAIVILMLLPLVYGAVYLWAFWNPFGNVNKMPVALVNSDRGTVVSGKQVNAGDEIVTNLIADGDLDWHVVDSEQARNGVEHGEYYFMLELPSNFSEAIASPQTGQPQKADLVVVYNDANNYISSSIGQTAISQVLNAVSTQISGQSVNQVLSELLSSGAGIKQAADPLLTLSRVLSPIDAQNAAISLTSTLRAPGSPLQSALDEVGSTGRRLTIDLNELRDGARQLASGSTQLASGIVQLDDGARQLKSGTEELKTGSNELATKLADGAKQLPDWTPQQKDAIANTIGGPVQVSASDDNPAPNFGTGMAPFFLTLALFFGALVLWMVLRSLQSRAIAAEVLAVRVVLASYLPAAVLGVFQAVILYCVVRFALAMHVAHPAAMLGFMILVSFAFVAATQAINALVGPEVGRVLIMALLMVQLVSAGGMYPVQTTSQPFQTLHRFDPMTFGVNGLRQLILGGIDGRLWQAIIVMVGIWVVSLTISSLSARRDRLWTLDRLIPAIKV